MHTEIEKVPDLENDTEINFAKVPNFGKVEWKRKLTLAKFETADLVTLAKLKHR